MKQRILKNKIKDTIPENIYLLIRNIKHSIRKILSLYYYYSRGFKFAKSIPFLSFRHTLSTTMSLKDNDKNLDSINPLLVYINAKNKGPGIVKWEHYFDIYHKHFASFVDTPVSILEIGVYSGGSLEMWRQYFGTKSKIYGVDIQPKCLKYQNDGITIIIGDQASTKFWREFKNKIPNIDILIDDGGHSPKQQMITLEQMLPYLNPGGVYVCEDVHGIHNGFALYVSGLISQLNANSFEGSINSFQSACYSIHFYPFMIVIEKRRKNPSLKFHSIQKGTEWQNFYNE